MSDQPQVTPDDVERAAGRLAGRVRVTPVIVVGEDLGLSTPITLKLELLQHVGSFKPRGAFNRVLSAGAIPDAGLVAASGGNHGAAVAFVAHALGLRAEVFVPASSPAMKRDRIASLGAHVHVVEGLYDDAQAAATEHQARTGALAVHPFDHPDVVAGQGTMSFELDRQVPDFDTLIVASGGGGFTAGQAAWWSGRRRVISVEPETSQCLHAARMAGAPTPVTVAGVAADSLGAATARRGPVERGAPPCARLVARHRRRDPQRAAPALGPAAARGRTGWCDRTLGAAQRRLRPRVRRACGGRGVRFELRPRHRHRESMSPWIIGTMSAGGLASRHFCPSAFAVGTSGCERNRPLATAMKQCGSA